MRECRKCKKIKPLEEFYEHRISEGGRINTCKNCKKEYNIQYQIRLSEKELDPWTKSKKSARETHGKQ